MAAEILPKSHTGWMSLTSVRVKTFVQLTSDRRASVAEVCTQLSLSGTRVRGPTG